MDSRVVETLISGNLGESSSIHRGDGEDTHMSINSQIVNSSVVSQVSDDTIPTKNLGEILGIPSGDVVVLSSFQTAEASQIPPHQSQSNNPQAEVMTHQDNHSNTAPASFVSSLGAWSKPLRFTPPITPPEPSTPTDFDSAAIRNQIESFWPSLSEGLRYPKKKSLGGTPAPLPHLPIEKLPPPELKEDGTLRFPWAARMNPATRNLFRAAKPTYRLDGTPEVTIPSKVMKLGPENKDEYIIGQFHRCLAPSGGLVHAVVNRLWGRSCRISGRRLGDSTILFHIPHAETRQWVIHRGVWHIDDCLMFVAPWNSLGSFNIPEISTIPVWVNLKNVPGCCYSRLGISHVASGLGEPMVTHKPRLDPLSLGEAKILVEVELDKPFPKKIALDDKLGNIYLVDVEYTWIPTACDRCGGLGHKGKWCLLTASKTTTIKDQQQTTTAGSEKMTSNDTEVQEASNKEVVEHVCNEQISDENVLSPTIREVSVLEDQSAIRAAQIQTKDQGKIETRMATQSPSFCPPEKANTNANDQLQSSPQLSVIQQVTTASTQVQSQSLSLITIPLVGTSPAPTSNVFMESSPSITIIAEPDHSEDDHLLATPQFNNSTTLDSSLAEMPPENIGSVDIWTRGGRQVRPTQKIQDMEWTMVRGRNKRGRGRRS